MKIAGEETGARILVPSRCGSQSVCLLLVVVMVVLGAETLPANDTARHFPLLLKPDDVLATGNEAVALPTIRASDGLSGVSTFYQCETGACLT